MTRKSESFFVTLATLMGRRRSRVMCSSERYLTGNICFDLREGNEKKRGAFLLIGREHRAFLFGFKLGMLCEEDSKAVAFATAVDEILLISAA